MRHGPWIQELLSYKARHRRKLIKRATGLGATAIGISAHTDVPTDVPGAALKNFSPFIGGDFSKIRPAYWKMLDDTVQRINKAGAVAVVYGLMFPGIRRGRSFMDFNYKGVHIPLSDWERYEGLAKIAWEDFWKKVNDHLGHNKNKVVYVDGVEPFTNRLQRPPNVYTAGIAEITPWAYKAYAGGEIHADPGKELAPHSPEPVLAYDGWGNNTRVWTIDERNRDGTITRRKLQFAGLPQVFTAQGKLHPRGRKYDKAAAESVGRWFRNEYRVQKAYREYFLWLHTPGWGAYNFASAKNVLLQRPGVIGFPLPFEETLRVLKREAARDSGPLDSGIPADVFDLKSAILLPNNANVRSWKVTSRVVATISGRVIHVPHTMHSIWPAEPGQHDKPSYGNAWVVFRFEGKWYTGSWEWLSRVGAGTAKEVTADNIGGHVKFGIGPRWRPTPGEVSYMFVTTLARLGMRSIDERSNIVKVVWP